MFKILLFLTLLGNGVLLEAANVCDRRCQGDARSENCLKINYACGRYEDVISVLTIESIHNYTLREKYFLGISYYGLHFRASLVDDKCQYARSAKKVLREYLLEMSKLYHDGSNGGSWGPIYDMQSVYHATKVYKILDQFSGCLNDGMASEEATILVKEQTVQFVDNIFLDSNNRDIAEAKDAIFTKVGDIISLASDFETKMALNIVALNTAERHLNEINLIFQNDFGASKSQLTSTQKKVLSDYARLSSLKRKYEDAYNEIDIFLKERKKVLNKPTFDKANGNDNQKILVSNAETELAQIMNQSSTLFTGSAESALLDLINSFECLGDSLLKDSLDRIVQSWDVFKVMAEKEKLRK